MTADKISVGELATTQIVALPPVPACAQLVAALQGCQHEAFPVTAEVAQAYRAGEDAPSRLLGASTARMFFFVSGCRVWSGGEHGL